MRRPSGEERDDVAIWMTASISSSVGCAATVWYGMEDALDGASCLTMNDEEMVPAKG